MVPSRLSQHFSHDGVDPLVAKAIMRKVVDLGLEYIRVCSTRFVPMLSQTLANLSVLLWKIGYCLGFESSRNHDEYC